MERGFSTEPLETSPEHTEAGEGTDYALLRQLGAGATNIEEQPLIDLLNDRDDMSTPVGVAIGGEEDEEEEDDDGPVTMANMEARSRAMDAKAAREAELDAEEMRNEELAEGEEDELAGSDEGEEDEDEEDESMSAAAVVPNKRLRAARLSASGPKSEYVPSPGEPEAVKKKKR